jgi:hypothetical protein
MHAAFQCNLTTVHHYSGKALAAQVLNHNRLNLYQTLRMRKLLRPATTFAGPALQSTLPGEGDDQWNPKIVLQFIVAPKAGVNDF